jgi:hypothetical protein
VDINPDDQGTSYSDDSGTFLDDVDTLARQARRAHLYATTEGILPWFADGGTPSAELRALSRTCWDLWQAVREPGLSEEYRALNVDFFDWLEAHASGGKD